MPTKRYTGTVMGREIVYERSPQEVQADIDRLDPNLRKTRLRRPSSRDDS